MIFSFSITYWGSYPTPFRGRGLLLFFEDTTKRCRSRVTGVTLLDLRNLCDDEIALVASSTECFISTTGPSACSILWLPGESMPAEACGFLGEVILEFPIKDAGEVFGHDLLDGVKRALRQLEQHECPNTKKRRRLHRVLNDVTSAVRSTGARHVPVFASSTGAQCGPVSAGLDDFEGFLDDLGMFSGC